MNDFPVEYTAELVASANKRKGKTATPPPSPPAVLVPSQSDPATRFFYDGRGFFLEYGQTYVPFSDVASVRRHLRVRPDTRFGQV